MVQIYGKNFIPQIFFAKKLHFLWYFLQNPCHTHSNKRFLGQEIALAGEQRQRPRYAFAAEKPHSGANQRIWSAVQPLSAPCEVGGITTKPYSKIQRENCSISTMRLVCYNINFHCTTVPLLSSKGAVYQRSKSLESTLRSLWAISNPRR